LGKLVDVCRRQGENELETATDETLGIEDSVFGVHGSLVFCGIADHTLFGGEGDI
jgi:hypothetical protein